MKSSENPYDPSQVRVDHEYSMAEQNPYAPTILLESHESPANHALHNEFARGSTKIRVIPLLVFVVVGLILGQYFISPTMLPASRHVLQQFRGAAIGALLGVLMYALMEYLFPREN